MNKLATIYIFCVLTLTGCTEGPSPKDSFESRLNGCDDRISLLIASKPNVSLVSSSYDIQKTDSLVSPFTAEVKLNFAIIGEHSTAKTEFGYNLYYAFQNNEWQHVKTTNGEQSLPEVDLGNAATLVTLDITVFSVEFRSKLSSVVLKD